MKFLKRLHTKWLILLKRRELAKRLDRSIAIKGVLSFYREAAGKSESSQYIRDYFRHEVYKLESTVEWYELQAARLAIRIEILEESLKC